MRLSVAHHQLIQQMHEIQYGTVRELVVRDGAPVSWLIQEERIVGKGNKRTEPIKDFETYARKERLVAFHRDLVSVGNGVISCVQIQDGLPYKIRFQERTTDSVS